jgi:hypothetical protein
MPAWQLMEMQSVSSLQVSPASRLGAPTKHAAPAAATVIANMMEITPRMLTRHLRVAIEPVMDDRLADTRDDRADEEARAQIHGATP